MKRAVLLGLLFIAACGPASGVSSSVTPTSAASATTSPSSGASPTPPPAASATRSPSSGTSPTPPSAASYAVMVQDGGPSYTAYLVATDGGIAASATARKRTTFAQMSNLSTSSTTLYYLDGDSDVHFLRPDGTTGLATQIALGPNHVAAFAVSPDDIRIAVAVLDMSRYPVSTRLYVQDLHGGGNHLELFSSPTVMEWPVGWHNGNLVMALGINEPPQGLYEGFARGHGYHVADALNGNKLQEICPGGDGLEPESPAGILCVQYGSNNTPIYTLVSWEGAVRPARIDGNCADVGPLSPGGVMASRTAYQTATGGCGPGTDVFLVSAAGGLGSGVGKFLTPEGWMDNDHLVLFGDPNVVPDTFQQPPAVVVDVATGAKATIQATGFFAAALPGGL